MITRTFTRPFQFMTNGLASLKDLRTGTPLTMTGGALGLTNLLTGDDSTFEAGVGSWGTPTNVTSFASDAAEHYEGTHSGKMVIRNVNAATERITITALVSSSHTYTFTAKFKGVAGEGYRLAFNDNISGTTWGTTVTATGGWDTATVTHAFGAGITAAYAYLCRATGAAGSVVYWDSAFLSIHDWTNPSNFLSLLGADAPIITTGNTCKIATPFVAGSPITIMIACQSTWAGNDNAFHWLFETASGSQRVVVQKTNLNDLRIYTKDAAGNTKTRAVSLYAGTWLANVPHIIIITLDAANNQRIWFDGVEGLVSVGAGVRESAVGADSYFGSDSTGAAPASAAILAAIYDEIIDDVPTTGEGIVSFTFDNGWATQYTDGLPVLESQDVDATFFILPGYLDGGLYMSTAQVQDLYALGHEIGSHTWSHPDLPDCTPEQLDDELSDSKDWIETNCGPCHSFATPNGLYNDAVLAAIKLYYDSHRTADDGRNSVFRFDEYLLKIHFVANTTTPADVAGWIAEAAASKEWLILVYHVIGDAGTANYCTAADLEAHVISAKTSGLQTLTVNDALDIYDSLVDDSGVGKLTNLAAWSTLAGITITGLATGNAAKLSDSSGTLIDSAAESGGQAVLDASTCDFNSNPDTSVGGFRGTLRVFDGAAAIGMRKMQDIWGGDVYVYTLSLPATPTKPIKPQLQRARLKIEIWNKADTDRLAILTKDNEDPDLCFQDLEFSNNHWGYLSCTFTLKRDSDLYWEDLEDSNIVRVLSSGYAWVGDIEGVGREKDKETTLKVECLGPQAKLKNMGTDADYDKDLEPGETASTYIVDHVLTDLDLGLSEGDINTNDFAIITGCTFFPGKAYDQIFSQLMEYNEYRPSIWLDNKLNWKPRETTISYYVNIADCKQSSLNRKRASIVNWVQVAFSPDNSVYGYVVAFDQTSIDKHGKRVSYLSIRGDEIDANQVAATALAQSKDLTPASALTTDIIRDANSTLVPPEEVESNKVLHIEKLLSTEETIESAQSINESNTWEIAEVKYTGGKVTLSPGEEDDTLDVLLKQLDSRFL